jgi:hypothetical protein
LSRGGQRAGAGRPGTSNTYRTPVSWRLPADLLVRVRNHANAANVSVTAWVELALVDSLKHSPKDFRKRLPELYEEMAGRR